MTMNDTNKSRTPPVDRVKSLDGSIEIAIWRNENDEGRVSYSMTEAERSYFDKDRKKWVTTTTIFDRDAAELSLMYARANERMRELREGDYQRRKSADQTQAA